MKIYLSSARSNSLKNKKITERIVAKLEKLGNKVYLSALLNDELEVVELSQKERRRLYMKSMREMAKSDVVVVELSYPSSAGVGHEMSTALEKGKPVVALYEIGKDPFFIQGKKDDRLVLMPYDERDLEEVLEDGLVDATEQMDVRFNFFVSPKIVNYLDWIAKKKRMPRAVYLRRLIEGDIVSNDKFLKQEGE